MQAALVQLMERRSTGRAHDLEDRRAHFARLVELEIVPGVAHGANRTARGKRRDLRVQLRAQRVLRVAQLLRLVGLAPQRLVRQDDERGAAGG